jgi:hypothetical protein
VLPNQKFVLARLGRWGMDLPSMVYNALDNARALVSVLENHDNGILRGSSMLWTQTKRDPRIRGVVGFRTGSLVDTAMEFKPATDKRLARQVCEFWGGGPKYKGAWRKWFGDPDVQSLLDWGIGVGVGLGFTTWDRKDTFRNQDVMMPSVQVFDPQFVSWYQPERRFMLATTEGLVPVPRPDEDQGDWIVFTPYGYQYGWRHGLVRALGALFIDRTWNRAGWARRNEVYGQPIRKAITGPGVMDEDKDKWFNDVQRMGAETVIMCEVGEDGKPRYDVQLVEAGANNSDTFEAQLESLDNDAAVAVLGQALTTQMQGGGSRSAADTGMKVTQSFARQDGNIAMTFVQGPVRRWCQLNLGDESLAPGVRYVTEPPEDKGARATTLLSLGNAITALEGATGDAIDVDDLLESFGVKTLDGDALEQKRAEKLQRAQDAMALEAGPDGEDDGGGESGGGSDGGGGGDPEKKPPPSPVKKKAKAALSARAASSKKRKLYPERAAEKALPVGGQALGPLLAAVNAALKEAGSYDEARAVLVDAFKDHEPKVLATAIAKLRLMSNLAGRQSAIQQL